MKRIFAAVLVVLLCVGPAFAEDADIGFFSQEGYALFQGFLAIVCGIAFVLGLRQ